MKIAFKVHKSPEIELKNDFEQKIAIAATVLKWLKCLTAIFFLGFASITVPVGKCCA
jgi:hypothetical protein